LKAYGLHRRWTLVFNREVSMSQKGVHIEPAEGKL